jgi:hypothetical protein
MCASFGSLLGALLPFNFRGEIQAIQSATDQNACYSLQKAIVYRVPHGYKMLQP